MNNTDLTQWIEAYPGPLLLLSIVANRGIWHMVPVCVYVRVQEANRHTHTHTHTHTVLPLSSKNQYSAEEHVRGIQTQLENL
jgi:hypothetical protein